MYDPESVIQDADIEMMDLEAAARYARASGRCNHGYTREAPDGKVTCLDCGKVFKDRDEAEAAWQARYE